MFRTLAVSTLLLVFTAFLGCGSGDKAPTEGTLAAGSRYNLVRGQCIDYDNGSTLCCDNPAAAK